MGYLIRGSRYGFGRFGILGRPRRLRAQRLAEQIDVPRRQKRRPVEKWIRKLAEDGVRPVVKVFERPDIKDLDKREMTWIASGRLQGWRLLNVADGGVGVRGYRHTDETKASISASLTGRKMPDRGDEWRRNLSEAKKGKQQSPETIAKRAASQVGKQHSAETKAKIGEAHKGRKHTEESKQKMSESKLGVPNPKSAEAHRGIPLTEDHKKKISDSVRANPATGEAKERQIQAARQRPSDDTRAKMSEARRAWWARKREEESDQ